LRKRDIKGIITFFSAEEATRIKETEKVST
jgi:hypothetical protein